MNREMLNVFFVTLMSCKLDQIKSLIPLTNSSRRSDPQSDAICAKHQVRRLDTNLSPTRKLICHDPHIATPLVSQVPVSPNLSLGDDIKVWG